MPVKISHTFVEIERFQSVVAGQYQEQLETWIFGVLGSFLQQSLLLLPLSVAQNFYCLRFSASSVLERP